MSLTKDQIKHIAKLANFSLTDEELQKYSEQISNVLDYIEQLNQVDVSNIEPTFNVSGQNTVERGDETIASLPQEEALLNASQKSEGKFITKGVFTDE